MQSRRRYSKTVDEYQNRFGPMPEGVLRSAPVVEQASALQEAAAQAMETGEPIRDWRQFVVRQPEPSGQAA